MNNQDIPVLFLARRVPSASNGRGNFKFKNGILYSYDNVIAVFSGDELLVNADTFSATSSRHQSAIKRAADSYTLVPDLTSLVEIMERRDEDEVAKFILRRKLAVSEYERKIEASRSENMRVYLNERIRMERDAARRAIKCLPMDKAMSVFSGHLGFFRTD